MYTCCYCEQKKRGKNNYAVPEGFPKNPVHDGKPLCDDCGSQPTPTLDEICQKLDRDLRLAEGRTVGHIAANSRGALK